MTTDETAIPVPSTMANLCSPPMGQVFRVHGETLKQSQPRLRPRHSAVTRCECTVLWALSSQGQGYTQQRGAPSSALHPAGPSQNLRTSKPKASEVPSLSTSTVATKSDISPAPSRELPGQHTCPPRTPTLGLAPPPWGLPVYPSPHSPSDPPESQDLTSPSSSSTLLPQAHVGIPAVWFWPASMLSLQPIPCPALSLVVTYCILYMPPSNQSFPGDPRELRATRVTPSTRIC